MQPEEPKSADSPRVQRALPRHRDRAARTLASAFGADPFFCWLVGNTTDAEDRLLGFFQKLLELETARDGHLVDVVDDGAGVAIWHEVDQWRASPGDTLKMAPAALRTYRQRVPIAMRAAMMVEAAHPKAPHRHLAYIGVDRSQQGRGLGGALLASATVTCDEQGIPAYLENLNPRNAPLYHRYAFTDTGDIKLPKGAPPVMSMWREPR